MLYDYQYTAGGPRNFQLVGAQVIKLASKYIYPIKRFVIKPKEGQQ